MEQRATPLSASLELRTPSRQCRKGFATRWRNRREWPGPDSAPSAPGPYNHRLLAIGALEVQVLTQFLVEAVVLSGLGGFIGIMLGLGLPALATRVLEVPFVLAPTIVLIAFAFSAIVGVVFGYFPTRRAAHLDPIEALRHE